VQDETGVTLRCANFDGKRDPLTHPADIGRFGEAVLLYDRVILLSHDLREIVGLIHYFGEEAIQALLAQGVLTIQLQQEFPAFVNTDEATTIRPGIVMAATPNHPRHDDPFLRSEADVAHLISSRLATYPYLDDYRGAGEKTVAAVIQRTHLAPRKLMDSVQDGFVAWLGTTQARQTTARLISARTGRMCLIDRVVDAQGNVRPAHQRQDDENAYVEEHLWNDLLIAFDAYYEVSMTPLAGNSAALSQFHVDAVLEPAANLEDRHSSAFREILRLEELPRIGEAFYREPISGMRLLEMRDHPDTKRLRRWLAASSGEDGRSVASAYLNAVRRNVHEDGIVMSGFRALGTIAAGLLSAAVGPVATVGEWAFSKFYYRKDWSPRVFIDRAVPDLLERGTRRPLVVPPDASRLLRDAWAVVELSHSIEKGVLLKFSRNPGETFRIQYGRTVDDYRLLNTILDPLLASAGDSSVTVQCFGCREMNRFRAIDATRNRPSCRSCRVKVLPFMP
jgi:hypothetical protein